MKFVLYPFIYALVIGGISFSLGFFGPMILDPTSGNGPLLGIFITGPLGCIAGFFIGLAAAFLKKKKL